MASLVRMCAALACAFVALGFAMFAVEELRRGSHTQQAKLAEALGEPAPRRDQEQARERQHDPLREFVDDVDDVLLAPFSNIVSSKDVWVRRGLPALLALLAYGVVLALLANFLPRPRAHGGDWRTT